MDKPGPNITITTWLDENGNNKIDAGEEQRVVSIAGVQGGKDITDALKTGSDRLGVQFARLSYAKELLISGMLVNAGFGAAWSRDITTLKGTNMEPVHV